MSIFKVMMAMLFSVAIFAFENEQLANYKAKIADFFLFLSFILLLCVHKEVARNAPALHAGPLRFLPRRKKLGKKGFTIWSLRGI